MKIFSKNDSSTSIVADILKLAVENGISSLELIRQEDGGKVVDGTKSIAIIPLESFEDVVARIEIIAEITLGEHTTPQKGSFEMKVLEEEINVEVTFLPDGVDNRIIIKIR